jgi:hypothetical protein
MNRMERLTRLSEMLDREAPINTFGTDQMARDLYKLVNQLGNIQKKAELTRDLVMLLSDPDSGPKVKRVLEFWMTMPVSESTQSDPETIGNPSAFHLR